MMVAKIDKRELKEPDKLQLFFLHCREFVERNRKMIYTGAGVFILALVIISSWYFYQLNYQAGADKLYSKIFESTLKPGTSNRDASVIKGYTDLIAQYPRSRSAIIARYQLGNLYRDRHEIDAAINAYQEFLDRASKDDDLTALSYSGLGLCYEEKKDFVKALHAYEKSMSLSAATPFEALNYGNIARVYELMNNPSKASEYYRKALEKTTDPLMTLYLKRKIAFLG